MVLDRTCRTRFLTRATLDAIVDVGTCGLAFDDLVHVRGANVHALSDPCALLVIDLDRDAYLLALPLTHVGHSYPASSMTLGERMAVFILLPNEMHVPAVQSLEGA
jgi:hypothetical protein